MSDPCDALGGALNAVPTAGKFLPSTDLDRTCPHTNIYSVDAAGLGFGHFAIEAKL